MAHNISNTPSHREAFLKGVGGSFLLKIYNTGIAFVISLVLARALHAAGYGLYAYALAWVYILVLPVMFGLDRLIIRRAAVLFSETRWSELAGLMRQATGFVIFTSVVTVVSAWFLLRYTGLSDVIKGNEIVSLALISLIPLSLIRVLQSFLQGIHHVVSAQIPEMMVHPTLLLLLLGIALVTGIVLLDPLKAIIVYLSSISGALIVGIVIFSRKLPRQVREIEPAIRWKGWLKGALPLMINTGSASIMVYADVLMLGLLSVPEETGIYHIASRLAGLISFILLAVNANISPIIAQFYAANELKRLQNALVRSARGMLVVSLILTITIVFAGRWLLLFFGPEFEVGYSVLITMAFALLIRSTIGSVAMVLIMTGHERDAALWAGIGAVANVILNAVLIPYWAGLGAAIATGMTLVLTSLVLLSRVKCRLGITTTALGRLGI